MDSKFKNVKELTFKYFIDNKWSDSVYCLDVRDTATAQVLPETVKRIGVGDKMTPDKVLEAALQQNFRHIVQASSVALKDELNIGALMLEEQSMFLNYPLSSILLPGQADEDMEKKLAVVNFKFSSSSQKQDLFVQVENYLASFSRSQSLVSDTCVLVDELFTNAIFNAPFTDLDNNHPGYSRHSGVVTMHPGKEGVIKIGRNDTKMVITCEDPYGTLNLQKLLERVKKCYSQGLSNSIQLGEKGGAGLGSFMVFNTSSSYYMAVQRLTKTVIAAALPIKMSNRKRAMTPKNLHYFEFVEPNFPEEIKKKA